LAIAGVTMIAGAEEWVSSAFTHNRTFGGYDCGGFAGTAGTASSPRENGTFDADPLTRVGYGTACDPEGDCC